MREVQRFAVAGGEVAIRRPVVWVVVADADVKIMVLHEANCHWKYTKHEIVLRCKVSDQQWLNTWKFVMQIQQNVIWFSHINTPRIYFMVVENDPIMNICVNV